MLKGRELFGMIIRLLQHLQPPAPVANKKQKQNRKAKKAIKMSSSYLFFFFFHANEILPNFRSVIGL